MTNSERALSEIELDLVSGGLRDDPWSDARNQQIAAQNSGTGFGGSLNNILTHEGNPNSSIGGNPFDWP